MAFAFGGEAQLVDYSRAMADAALLALVACLGLAQLSHETTSYVTQLGCTALLFFAASAMAYHPYSRRRHGVRHAGHGLERCAHHGRAVWPGRKHHHLHPAQLGDNPDGYTSRLACGLQPGWPPPS